MTDALKSSLSLLSIILLVMIATVPVQSIPFTPAQEIDVDPMRFSTFFGSTQHDMGKGIALDTDGNIIVVGQTTGIIPTLNAFDDSYNGGTDIFVLKLAPSGNQILFSTYIGGSDIDQVECVSVDEMNYIYITGETESEDFPLESAAYTNHSGGGDAFMMKLSPTGELNLSTYLGGQFVDDGLDIVGNENGIFLTGTTYSPDFPIASAFDPSFNGFIDGFVTKFTHDGTLEYSTYIGGTDADHSLGMEVDIEGNAYITGRTGSVDFPLLHSFDSTLNNDECFLVKINSSGTGLFYSTFLGGTFSERAEDIDITEDGCVYLTGWTDSVDFPLMNPIDDSQNGSNDCFVTKMNSTGNGILFSTYLGGSDSDRAYSIRADNWNCCYICGETWSEDFPIVNSFDPWQSGSDDGFVLKLSSVESEVLFSGFIGGSEFEDGNYVDVDSEGNCYTVGTTSSADYLVWRAYDNTFNGLQDCFVHSVHDLGDSDHDTIPDYYENAIGSDRHSNDSDSDTIPDVWEYNNGMDPAIDDRFGDLDNDSLLNIDEFLLGTNVSLPDSDSDNMTDGWEVFYGLDPLYPDHNLDPDDDDLLNLIEFLIGTSPISNDTDFDLLPDAWEYEYGLNPLEDDSYSDLDNDLILNLHEFGNNTSPISNDSDSDSMMDYWEIVFGLDPTFDDSLGDLDSDTLNNLAEFLHSTDPRMIDSDSDSMDDAWEVLYGLNPIVHDGDQDLDGDLLTNLVEYQIGTNPSEIDSDLDGYSDFWEQSNGYDPTNPNPSLVQILHSNIFSILIIVGIVIFVGLVYRKQVRIELEEVAREVQEIEELVKQLESDEENRDS